MTLFYNGNKLLKAAGVTQEYTKSDISEYIKCKEDPIYFIETYCKVVSLDHGIVPFKLYPYQKRFILSIHNNRKVISKQARQSGKTQCVAAYLLHYTIFNDNKTVAVLANKGAAAREILARYKNMYELIPPFLQQGVLTWNKGDIELENKSVIFTSATSSDGIRGKSCNVIYLDEFAIVPNTVADEFMTSTYPTISSGDTTKVIITSTPLGYNHFWKYWNDADKGLNGFIPVNVHWSEHPNRDEAWAAEQLAILGSLKFNQEIETQFLGSSNTLIDSSAISKMTPKNPIYSKDGLDLYEYPVNKKLLLENNVVDHTYVIVVDTGKGVGGDYSAFVIIDITSVPYRIVGKYRNAYIAPMLFPSIIHKVATDYNCAFVLIEINSSEQVPHILHYELEYENILMVSRDKNVQTVSSGYGNSKPGVTTDKRTKRIGCSNIKSMIEENKIIIEDYNLIEEISTFIQIKDSYAADDGYNDDLMMTLVLFGWLSTQQYFRDLTDVDMRKLLYQQRVDSIEAESLPIGCRLDGTEEEFEQIHNF